MCSISNSFSFGTADNSFCRSNKGFNADNSFSFSGNSKTSVKLEQSPSIAQVSSLYLPPREMFSLFEGFLGLNAQRELAFDETYVKLAEALDGPILRGSRYDEIKKLISPLEDALQAKAIKENGRFSRYPREASS